MAKLSAKVIEAAGSDERVELAPEPAHPDRTWVSSYEIDPFDVPDADKTGLLAEWSGAAAGGAGGRRTSDASLLTVQENKFYADTAGTITTQQRVRLHSQLTAVAVDPVTGEFDSMRTLAPPVGRGWEYLTGDRLRLGRRAGADPRATSRRSCTRRASRRAPTTW